MLAILCAPGVWLLVFEHDWLTIGFLSPVASCGRSFEPLAHQLYFLQHCSFTLFDVLDAFRSSAGNERLPNMSVASIYSISALPTMQQVPASGTWGIATFRSL